jgi:hypothetical protein
MRLSRRTAIASAVVSSATFIARAAFASNFFIPDDLVVSSTTYDAPASTITVGQSLPGGGKAITNGSFYQVFDNDGPDSSFGITSPLTLLQYSVGGTETSPSLSSVGSLAVPVSDAVTSFSSKSEGALNLSADGRSLTFMGYSAPDAAVDVSNANTPGVIDSTNTDTDSPFYRAVVNVDFTGNFQAQSVNAYSGNNGRAAINIGNNQFITVGNAGNGSKSSPQINQVAAVTGVQLGTFGSTSTTELGSFSVTQTNPATGQPYSGTADKPGKDNNYRGETIYNNTLYVTKGSGSNGIDTVYQVGASGGLASAVSNPASATINPLPGFPTTLAANQSTAGGYYPFGIWFANPTTLYVADEGDGVYSDATTHGATPNAGLEKWSFNATTQKWQQDYTLQTGLIGSTSTATNFPYTIAQGGLRNITGQVNADGTVTIYGVTASLANLPSSGNDSTFDQGATPDELVAITDTLADTTLSQASGEGFDTLESSAAGQEFRGVSFAPVPEPTTLTLLAGGSALALLRRRRKQVLSV